MLEANFVSVPSAWRSKGNRLLLFMDMNDNILEGLLGRKLINGKVKLQETKYVFSLEGVKTPHVY